MSVAALNKRITAAKADNMISLEEARDILAPNDTTFKSPTGIGHFVDRFEHKAIKDLVNEIKTTGLEAEPRALRTLEKAADKGPDSRFKHILRKIFGASGAAVLFRRAAIDEAAEAAGEIYDPRYFSYGEDIDLAWRLRALGWTVRYTPDAHAHHVGSGSLGGALRFLDKPAVFQRHALKNRYLTLLKNAPPGLLVEMGVALLLTDLALWPFLCLRQPLRVPYLLGGIADVIRLLPGSWRRRRLLQERSRLGGEAVRPWLSGL